MTLEIYNSLTRRKEQFSPVHPGTVTMYVCGMTVYSDAHIGHARTYLAFDIIRRYLEYLGYAVTYVQNITDVDDKIIAAAHRQDMDPLEYSRKYATRCLDDLAALGIRPADQYPKASENIGSMISMIEKIIARGAGYVADGDVYFAVDAFPPYGKLSGQKPDEMKAGARIDPSERKRTPLDFALWKAAKPGEPSWDSPWGRGRPGWHIECSAMSSDALGLPFDIHGGGMDLRFPHHENEIAQAEAATGATFARYWIHIGLLTIRGEKMSKSLGNIVNIRDLLARCDPEVVRMFFAQVQYRSPPDFTDKALEDVAKSLERLRRVRERLEAASASSSGQQVTQDRSALDKEFTTSIETLQREFSAAMDDDFNTPKAFAALFEFVSAANTYLESPAPSPDLCRQALDTYRRIGSVLTLFQGDVKGKEAADPALRARLQALAEQFHVAAPQTVEGMLDALLKARTEARAKKQWATADGIRAALLALGFEIQDTDAGPVWRKK